MFLKIVEPELVTIFEIDHSEFRYGFARIHSLEELDLIGDTEATPYLRFGWRNGNEGTQPVQWAKFMNDARMICVVMSTHQDEGVSAYLMNDDGETVERIV